MDGIAAFLLMVSNIPYEPKLKILHKGNLPNTFGFITMLLLLL